jgi:AcrR family transcriptional regulator
MTTKERIIETAINLFNEKGTKAVTTNHIAAAMGISPGNLYYHFRNKQEIIRAIYDQMDAVGLGEYGKIIAVHPAGSLDAMEETFLMIQRFNWRYRFFKRELTALILDDPLLRERHIRVHQAMLLVVRHSIESSISQGIIRQMDEVELGLYAEEIWLLTLFWLNYLEVGGEEVTEDTLRRGNELLRQSVKYRLTEKGAKIPAVACNGI